MKRIVLLLTAVLCGAVALGFMQVGSSPRSAEARLIKVIAINPLNCGWQAGGGGGFLASCTELPWTAQTVGTIASGIQSSTAGRPPIPSPLTADYFAKINISAGQLHEHDGVLVFLVFVADDHQLRVYSDVGAFLYADSESQTQVAGAEIHCMTQQELDAGAPIGGMVDEDCDDDGIPGDGVVPLTLVANPIAFLTNPNDETQDPNRGKAKLRVEEIYNHKVWEQQQFEFTVVGEPQSVAISLAKPTILVSTVDARDAVNDWYASCAYDPVTSNNNDRTLVIVQVKDSDGTDLTGVPVRVTPSDYNLAVPWLTPRLSELPTFDIASVGPATINLLCSQDKLGTATVYASPIRSSRAGAGLENGSIPWVNEEPLLVASTTLKVIGPPAKIELKADPQTLVCDGKNSSTISAVVKDADGNLMFDGISVTFNVKVLGAAVPVVGKTALSAGKASSKVTPLSGIAKDVPVLVQSGDAEASVAIHCQPAPQAASGAAPAAAAPSTVKPPATGSGGVSEGSASLAGLALIVGALGLATWRMSRRLMSR